MEALKRKFNESFSLGAKEITYLASIISKRCHTFFSHIFSSDHPSFGSKYNISTQNINDGTDLNFFCDSVVSMPKEELYFEQRFFNHNFCNEVTPWSLNLILFSKDNNRKEGLYGPLKTYDEDTKETNFMINEKNGDLIYNKLENKRSLARRSEEQIVSPIFYDDVSPYFPNLTVSNLNSISPPYISAENSLSRNDDHIISLKKEKYFTSVHTGNQESFKNWESSNDIEMDVYSYSCDEFNLFLESTKNVHSAKTMMRIFFKEDQKFSNKTNGIYPLILKSKNTGDQNTTGDMFFARRVKDGFKNSFILELPVSPSLKAILHSEKVPFTEVNPIDVYSFVSQHYNLFSGRQLDTFLERFLKCLSLEEQIELLSNLRSELLYSDFDAKRTHSNSVKCLDLQKAFEINEELLLKPLQTGSYKNTVDAKLTDFNQNISDLSKIILFPENTKQDYRNETRYINVESHINSNDKPILRYIYDDKCESKSSAKFSEYYTNSNGMKGKYIGVVNNEKHTKCLDTAPNTPCGKKILPCGKKCESRTDISEGVKKKLSLKESNIMNIKNYKKNDANSCQKNFENGKPLGYSNAKDFVRGSIDFKGITTYSIHKNAAQKHVKISYKDSFDSALDTKTSATHSVLKEDFKSKFVDHFNYSEYKKGCFCHAHLEYESNNFPSESHLAAHNVQKQCISSDKENVSARKCKRKTLDGESRVGKNLIKKLKVQNDYFNYSEYIKRRFCPAHLDYKESSCSKNCPSESHLTARKVLKEYASSDKESVSPRKSKRKTLDDESCVEKSINKKLKVRNENCQNTEVSIQSIKKQVLNTKRCCVLLNRLEISHLEALNAVENLQSSSKNRKDKTEKPSKGMKRKYYQEYKLNNKSEGSMNSMFSTDSRDFALRFELEQDASVLSAELETSNIKSKLSGPKLSSTRYGIKSDQFQNGYSKTKGENKWNFEEENTKKKAKGRNSISKFANRHVLETKSKSTSGPKLSSTRYGIKSEQDQSGDSKTKGKNKRNLHQENTIKKAKGGILKAKFKNQHVSEAKSEFTSGPKLSSTRYSIKSDEDHIADSKTKGKNNRDLDQENPIKKARGGNLKAKFKNRHMSVTKSKVNSCPETTRNTQCSCGAKSANKCLCLETEKREKRCVKLRNSRYDPLQKFCTSQQSDSYIMSTHSNTFYSRDGKSHIVYNKTIQAKYETPSTSKLKSHLKNVQKTFTGKRKNAKWATNFQETQFLFMSGDSIDSIKSDFRLPLYDIKNTAKRNKDNKKELICQDSKSKRRRMSDSNLAVVVASRKQRHPIAKEMFGPMIVFHSGVAQIATIDDLCLKSTKREYSNLSNKKYLLA